MIDKAFQLDIQRRDGQGNLICEKTEIDPEKTVAFVIDMWDYHPGKTFLNRVSHMIPRFNRTLDALRKLGIQVVHAPANAISNKEPMPLRKVRLPDWAETPQRKAVLDIPPQEAPPKIPYDPPMPPWHYTGTCECNAKLPCRKKGLPWDTQQWNAMPNKNVHLAENDLIGDADNEAEAINIMESNGYDTIIYLGIASNMCLAQYRMFGLHHMRRRGYRVLFVSDCVEAISGNGYDPDLEKPDPDLFPAKGSAIVQRHLEKYGGPSFLSRQLIDLAEKRKPNKKHLVFVIAEDSCDTQRTLPIFAKEHLEKGFLCTFCFADPKHRNSINGLDALYDADLLVLSMERRFLPAWQMDILARFIFNANKPVIALRPSVTAFAEGDGKRNKGIGRVVWNGFGREVLGCNFVGMCETQSEFVIRPVGQYLSHPILDGLGDMRIKTKNPLYRIMPLSLTATPLLMAEKQDVRSDQIAAWTNISFDSKVFYTSLGCPDDFGNKDFQRMLVNAANWAVGE